MIKAIFDTNAWLSAPAAMLARINTAGFNVLVPSVWQGTGARWPSSKFIPDSVAMTPDPLARIITAAHAAGIQVWPWICVGLRGAGLYPALWTATTPAGFYELSLPAFVTHICGVIDEIMGYNPDGIVLDFIRTGGSAYQTAAPSAVVDAIRKVIRRHNRQTYYAVCAGETYSKTDPAEGRNPTLWLNNQWIDLAWLMDYATTPNWSLVDTNRSWVDNPERMSMLIGNEMANVAYNPAVLVANIAACKTRNMASVAMFYYAALTDPQITALKGAW